MRERKYRAWDSKCEEMHYFKLDWQIEIEPSCHRPALQWHELEVMDFTGLTDKNGTPIYEGDIIGLVHITYDEEGEWAWDSIHEVVWGGKDYPAFDIKPNLYCEENGLSHLACSPEAPHYEVIGNKFEDKDLLE